MWKRTSFILKPAQIENAKRIWGKGMTGPVTLDRIIRKLQGQLKK